ncbi:TPA: SDR family oxidoreductase [Vibrio cholerae]|uniref:SDR family oxidoreductase n=3 Tax=Vibrio cholerae TaxID=666 RepID=A0A7I6K1D8_VIBCL|nr:SDR family oxidoreductase [Vibrio cholerae]ATD23434.1 UDP-glucose 4-epimerase [Vibrio cholerae]EET25513.1 UDP-galactose 4-epimerase [Vibrio cholerae MO10]EGR0497598.1 SDR family oxidoreductase [Vibrio cholerae]EGR2477423.1 SDR family oxidoreductase [Vibrio cholerae]EGR4335218.1 SDR family oxidoreductase [Vibrio cholerae]
MCTGDRKMPKSILLTGSTGFVGTNLVKSLTLKSDYIVKSAVRHAVNKDDGLLFEVGDINASTDFELPLKNTTVVVHCAARAHVMDDKEAEPLTLYREVNTAGTVNLAKQAIDSGVKRFIFISSIKVNGEGTLVGCPFKTEDNHAPEDDYGLSKSEAEKQLVALAKDSSMEVVIIRPTIVYGPGVKANFASLMRLVSKGIPLPFGSITQNKRSLVSINNLVDLIVTCIDHPKAANQVFLVSDDHDVSTAEMVRELAIALDKPTWQLPVPIWCYKLFGKLFGKSDIVDRLTGTLQVDISHTKETLGWKPPQTLQEGFKQTAQAFLQANNR